MPNGRPVPDGVNFWDESASVRAAFIAVYDPDLSEEDLAFIWLGLAALASPTKHRNASASSKIISSAPDPGCGPRSSDACRLFYAQHHWNGKKWVANKPAKPPKVSNDKLRSILAAI